MIALGDWVLGWKGAAVSFAVASIVVSAVMCATLRDSSERRRSTPRPPTHQHDLELLNAEACRRLLLSIRDAVAADYEQAQYDAEFVAIARAESQRDHPSWNDPNSDTA